MDDLQKRRRKNRDNTVDSGVARACCPTCGQLVPEKLAAALESPAFHKQWLEKIIEDGDEQERQERNAAARERRRKKREEGAK
jgi:hypothetical protein